MHNAAVLWGHVTLSSNHEKAAISTMISIQHRHLQDLTCEEVQL
jgi:hypothetical protein